MYARGRAWYGPRNETTMNQVVDLNNVRGAKLYCDCCGVKGEDVMLSVRKRAGVATVLCAPCIHRHGWREQPCRNSPETTGDR